VPTATPTATSTATPLPPDLSLTKQDGGDPAEPGGTIGYLLTYHNAGGDATGVVITETVPAHTTFNATASTTGWVCQNGGAAGSVCTLIVGHVPNGGGGSKIFAVTVDDPLPQAVTEIHNTAQIGDDGANGQDPTPADNVATRVTLVTRPIGEFTFYLYLPWVGKP
jgi:large repetitive protein